MGKTKSKQKDVVAQILKGKEVFEFKHKKGHYSFLTSGKKSVVELPFEFDVKPILKYMKSFFKELADEIGEPFLDADFDKMVEKNLKAIKKGKCNYRIIFFEKKAIFKRKETSTNLIIELNKKDAEKLLRTLIAE